MRGLAVLESDGHNSVRLCKFKRPGVEAKPEPREMPQLLEDAENSGEAASNVVDIRHAYEAALRRRSGNCSSF